MNKLIIKSQVVVNAVRKEKAGKEGGEFREMGQEKLL